MQFERRKKPEGFKELLVYGRAVELQDFTHKLGDEGSALHLNLAAAR
ncbi:MAG: hypothetical protein AAB451_01805 [Patescibacteria group bacterium]